MTEFDALIAGAAAQLADDLNRERRALAPDFAAVVEEAHARDPKRVPAAALAEVKGLAPVVDLHSSDVRAPRREQAEFAALLAEARAEIDADTAAARAAGPPGVPVPEARRAPPVWVWFAAAAALAALAFGLRPLLSQGRGQGPAAIQAPWQDQASPPLHETTSTPRPSPEPVKSPARGPAVAPAAALEPAVEPVAPVPATTSPIEQVEENRSKATGTKEQGKSRPRAEPPAETLAERLRRLDGEAEARWQAGDTAGAEALYREIVALAPGGRAADLAYGDLFSLARQRHGADSEVALWREYLQTFPRGRYADDARAGLCRRADDRREDCWRAYLADFPAGVHRYQAERVLAEAEP